MNKMMKLLYCITLTLFLCPALLAQEARYYNEIEAYKKADSVQMPASNSILFVGSSSIRLWNNLSESFPGYTTINRGFGGSEIMDVIRYANDIIFPYQPKQIVIYAGENDLASDPANITPDIVAGRFRALFNLIRVKLPNTPIVFISIKPSIARQNLMPSMVETNRKIRDYIRKQKNATYVDVYTKMLTSSGTPMTDIFVEDNLHMNAKGYAIWQAAIQPSLLK